MDLDHELKAIRKKKVEDMKKKASAPKVVVYSTQTCPYCVMVKDYLDKKGVKYVEYDVSSDEQKAEEMINKSGDMRVPQLEINGRMIIGFDRAAIDDALS